jgi:hypothetical protein
MKTCFLYFCLLASPFIHIVSFNEINFKKYYKIEIKKFGIKTNAYNSLEKLNICSWDCHTYGCSHRHKNVINVDIITSIYDRIVSTNKSAGDEKYTLMNLIVFVVILPVLTIWLFLLAVSKKAKIVQRDYAN